MTRISTRNAEVAEVRDCPECGVHAVRLEHKAHSFKFGTDEPVELTATLPIWTCEACGYGYTDGLGEEIEHAAICRHLGLLTPDEIRGLRNKLGLSRPEFARLTRFGEKSIKRWETGALIQSASADRFLRLINDPFVFERLQRLDAQSPIASHGSAKSATTPQDLEVVSKVVPLPSNRVSGPALPERSSKATVSRGLTPAFCAHLKTMTQYVSDVLTVVLFGVNRAVARADHGRPRARRLPGVTWMQEGATFNISADVGANKEFEVTLSLDSSDRGEPRAISWADPETLSDDKIVVDRFNVHRVDDGRYFVEINRRDLERRLTAISKAKREKNSEQVIAFSPLAEF
jgi:putative zinc finger/helix-turn-helix YgiT family protein